MNLLLLNRYNNHPVLNDHYLVLMLLGKGGFSEVHKVGSLVFSNFQCDLVLKKVPFGGLLALLL